MAAGIFTGDGKSLTPEAVIELEADLVVGLGLRNLEVLTPKPFGPPLVCLDSAGDPSLLNGFSPCAQIPAAIAEHFEWILQALESKSWGEDLVSTAVDRVRTCLNRDEWQPGRFLRNLQYLTIQDTCLVTDTGAFCTVAERIWQASSPAHFMASANGRYMGTAFPMAIGASFARRDAHTICVVGDGGIRPFWAEIKIAIAERLPILFVLLSDGRYGSVAAAASASGLTDVAINVPLPSWFRAAESVGCPAQRVTSFGGLEQVMKAWLQREGPFFVEASFDPEAYAAMTTDIR